MSLTKVSYSMINGSPVNVLDFGAIPNDNSLSAAQTNREAFRKACCSYQSLWEAQQTAGTNISVYVPPGDYNLANGFTVPPGVSLFGDGIGSARIHCRADTADATQIPLISLGKVIVDATGSLINTTGTYVVAPAPQVDNLYINPQNGNTAIDITDVAGFCLGKLWIQAAIGVNIAGTTSDGLIDQLIFDSDTAIGINFGDTAQNVSINSIETFVTNVALNVTGTPNNLDIGSMQCNYVTGQGINFAPSSASGRIRINNFVVNQNIQYTTFVSPIYIQGTSCDLSIGNMDARNYNGYAIDGGGGTSNKIYVEKMILRQTPNRSSYTTGGSAKGVNVNGINLIIDYFDAYGLQSTSFIVQGSGIATLKVNGGTIGTNNAVGINPEFYITNTNTQSYVFANNINNFSGNNLFAEQSSVPFNYYGSKTPFKIVLENSRNAIKIPFLGNVNAWEVVIYADTLPGGSPAYGRVVDLYITQETIYNTTLKTRVYGTPVLQSPTPAFPPDIAYQLDINSVNNGAEINAVTYGYVVVSIPSTYTNYTFNVRQL